MIDNLQELKPGSLIFLSYKNMWLSKWISYRTNFKYSYVSVYMGNNEVLETSWFGLGTKTAPLSSYLNNDNIEGEVCNPFSDLSDVKLFLTRIKKLKRIYCSCKTILEKALFNLGVEIPKKSDTASIQEIYEAVIKK